MENYNGADPLAEWCAAEMKLNIDGKALVIKPTMEHYRKLKAQDKNPNEEEVRVVLKDILKTTFPNSQSVDNFLERYETKFYIALMAEMVGISQEELKKKFFQKIAENEENLQKDKS